MKITDFIFDVPANSIIDALLLNSAIVLVQLLSHCLTLCDPMDCSTPGSLVLHYLLEFTQTHVHRMDVRVGL